jgi:hypothetical protein
MIVKLDTYSDCPSELHLHIDTALWVQEATRQDRVVRVFAFVHHPEAGLYEGGFVSVYEPGRRRAVNGLSVWQKIRSYLAV